MYYDEIERFKSVHYLWDDFSFVKLSFREIIDYMMGHDISCYTDSLEYQYAFRDMCDKMKKVLGYTLTFFQIKKPD
ncbi:MAG: hypothetical protein LUF02_05135 [Erysipelotrichaceae bacterium]|nr:hypothetical protein [Erysipelotrichaceae bacterium]